MKNKKLPMLNKTLIALVTVAYISLLGYFIYHYSEMKNFYLCNKEIILLLILTVIISTISMIPNTKKKDLTLFGKKVTKKTQKKVRMLNYIFEAVYFAVLITTIFIVSVVFNQLFVDYYSIIPSNVILSIVLVTTIMFIISFAIVFLLEYFVREKALKD